MVNWEKTQLFLYLDAGISVPSALGVLILFMVHISKVYYWRKDTTHNNNNNNDRDKRNNNQKLDFSLTALSILTLTFYTITSLLHAISSIIEAIPHPINCEIIVKSIIVSVTWSRYWLYLLLIARLHIAFKESIYGYNVYFLLSFICFTFCEAIAFSIIFIFGSTGNYIVMTDYFNPNNSDEDDSDVYIWCQIDIPDVMIYIYALIDVLINIFLTILFVKPLHKVMSMITLDNQNNSLQLLVEKNTIVAVITCMTSILFLGLIAILNWGALAGIDWMINCLCVLLISKHYDKWYHKCCKLCIIYCDKYRIDTQQKSIEMQLSVNVEIASQTSIKIEQ